MIDYAVQRANMIESQIRPNGITDARLIAAMATIPREAFVPEDRQALAYMDEDLPLGWDGFGRRRFLIEPMSLGRLVQMAVIETGDSVLDVGCATGYSSAVLSCLAKRVVALEDDPALAAFAMQQFRALGLDNIEMVAGPPALGHPALAPYQAIVVNGRLRRVPDDLVRQLAPAGRTRRRDRRRRHLAGHRADASRCVMVKPAGIRHVRAGSRRLPRCGSRVFILAHRIFVQCRIYSMTLELTLSSLFTCDSGESLSESVTPAIGWQRRGAPQPGCRPLHWRAGYHADRDRRAGGPFHGRGACRCRPHRGGPDGCARRIDRCRPFFLLYGQPDAQRRTGAAARHRRGRAAGALRLAPDGLGQWRCRRGME